jgi:c-di-GMP-binding flagellar brake protein YcgR
LEQHVIEINRHLRVTRAVGEEEWYASSVQDLDKKTFCISIPTQGPRKLVLNIGETVKISFVAETSRCEFETSVVGRRHDNIPLYELDLPNECKRIQLRGFVRIPVIIDVCYAKLPDAGQEPVFTKCSSLDLSGCGIRLLLKENFAEGTSLIIKFEISVKTRPEDVEVLGRVVRAMPEENVKGYQTAIQFEKISRRQQDLIVRFIYEKMSERRRLS